LEGLVDHIQTKSFAARVFHKSVAMILAHAAVDGNTNGVAGGSGSEWRLRTVKYSKQKQRIPTEIKL
jgi:hypothetical protein